MPGRPVHTTLQKVNMLEKLSTAGVRKVSRPGGSRLTNRQRCVTRRLRLTVHRVMVLFVLHGLTALCLIGNQATRREPGTCGYSNQVFDSDVSLMRREAPTRFGLMTSRYVRTVDAARGYQCTGTATIAFDGHQYLQAGNGDDPGMMELIPTVSRWIGMSLVDTYDLVVFVVIVSGTIIGYVGFWHLYPEGRSRAIGAAVFLCLGIAEARIADEYMFQISPLIAGIPWLVYFGLREKKLMATISASLLAFCCSWGSLVRSGSMVICLTFLLTMFAVRYRVQRPFLPILLIVLACVPSLLFQRHLIARRDNALAKLGESARVENSHAFWHTLYIGLGFIPNSEVSGYRDEVAAEKVRSIDPTVAYLSAKYQAILRRELWGIVRRRPMLVIGIVAAKVGIVILLASIVLYPARLLIFTEKATLWLDAAFLLTIGMSGMNGIVAVPRASYLLTFFCLAFLYSSIKLCRGYRLTIV